MLLGDSSESVPAGPPPWGCSPLSPLVFAPIPTSQNFEIAAMFTLLGFGMPGIPEMLIILVIMLLLFGSRLPSVMRSMGQGITEFKKGIRDEDTKDSSNISRKED